MFFLIHYILADPTAQDAYKLIEARREIVRSALEKTYFAWKFYLETNDSEQESR